MRALNIERGAPCRCLRGYSRNQLRAQQTRPRRQRSRLLAGRIRLPPPTSRAGDGGVARRRLVQKLRQQDASTRGAATGKQLCAVSGPRDPPLPTRDDIQHVART
eukprot:14886451-Alexandrium_andersonii.AAC.1